MNNGLFQPPTPPEEVDAMNALAQQQQQGRQQPQYMNAPPIPQGAPTDAEVADAMDASIQQGQKHYTGIPMLDKYIHLFIGQ